MTTPTVIGSRGDAQSANPNSGISIPGTTGLKGDVSATFLVINVGAGLSVPPQWTPYTLTYGGWSGAAGNANGYVMGLYVRELASDTDASFFNLNCVNQSFWQCVTVHMRGVRPVPRIVEAGAFYSVADPPSFPVTGNIGPSGVLLTSYLGVPYTTGTTISPAGGIQVAQSIVGGVILESLFYEVFSAGGVVSRTINYGGGIGGSSNLAQINPALVAFNPAGHSSQMIL